MTSGISHSVLQGISRNVLKHAVPEIEMTETGRDAAVLSED